MCLKMINCDLYVSMLCSFFLVISPCSTTQLVYQDYDYNYDALYDDWGTKISISTIPQNFKIHLGESVTLPCNTSANHLIDERRWTHGNVEILPTSQVKNMEMVNSTNLKVNVTSYSDAGVYVCEIEFFLSGSKSVSHTVEIIPKNLDEYKTTTDGDPVEYLTEENVTVDPKQNYSNHLFTSTSTTEQIPTNKYESKENTLQNSFLTTLSEAVQGNFFSGMSRQSLVSTKSAARSLDSGFWTICLGVYILRISAESLNLLLPPF